MKLLFFIIKLSLINCHTSLNDHMIEYIISQIDTDGLKTIHVKNYDETLVYENRVDLKKGCFENGVYKTRTRTHHIDKPNEKILTSSMYNDELYLFTKVIKNGNEFCTIKTVKYFSIMKTDYNIHNLCQLLKNVLVIKFESKTVLRFYYRDHTIKYSSNYDIEKTSLDVFKNLPSDYLYKKFISHYIVEFIYKNKTIEYNYITMKLLQVFILESFSKPITENNNILVNVACIATGSIVTLVITIIIVILKSKFFLSLFQDKKEINEKVGEMQEILLNEQTKD